MKQVQSQLAQQQKQLKDTQDQLAAAKRPISKQGWVSTSRRTEWIDRQNARGTSGTREARASESTTEFDPVGNVQRFPKGARADPTFAAQSAIRKHQSYDLMMLVGRSSIVEEKSEPL